MKQKILLFLLITLLSFAQQNLGTRSKKAEKSFLRAKQELVYRNYAGAEIGFKEAIKYDNNFALAYLYLLNVLTHKKKYKEALPYLEKLLTIKDKLPQEKRQQYLKQISFLAGKIYFYNEKYEQAYKYLMDFISKERERFDILQEAAVLADHAAFAKEAIKHKMPFNPKNLGPNINSPYEDYMPYLTADESLIFFTSRRPEGNLGEYSPSLKSYPEDFYYSKKQNNQWQKAENLGEPVNTPDNEGAACISQDGQIVIFTGCSRYDGLGSCDLYIARFKGTNWENPINMGKPINSIAWDAQPCLAHDGKTLYFVSNRKGTRGGADIWVSYFKNGQWTEPQNLGPNINTPGNEYAPFIHADGKTLYFASDYHLGFGGMDIFMSTLTDTGWTKPKNLGYPINTSKDDRNIYINTFGNRAYYNSDREGTLGKNDIFFFEMPEEIRPNPATFVRGQLKNSEGKPVYGTITLVDLETGDTVRQITSNPKTGEFLFSLPLNKDYAAHVETKGHLFVSKNFSLKNHKNPEEYYDLEITLPKLEKGATIELQNVFFDFDKYTLKPESQTELNKVANFLKQNPSVKIELAGHTDDRGSDEYNLQLSQKRAEAVKNYLVKKGISPSRIIAKGYGETKPIVPNDSEENRAKNRRTELKILEK